MLPLRKLIRTRHVESAPPIEHRSHILEGKDVKVARTSARNTDEHTAQRRAGVYLEPSEEATFTAADTPVVLLLVTVPKHTTKPAADQSPVGYFFEEAKLRALIDEKGFRERTFWVNKETGLSGSWDLQLGRMHYGPMRILRGTCTTARRPVTSHRSISTSSKRALVR